MNLLSNTDAPAMTMTVSSPHKIVSSSQADIFTFTPVSDCTLPRTQHLFVNKKNKKKTNKQKKTKRKERKKTHTEKRQQTGGN